MEMRSEQKMAGGEMRDKQIREWGRWVRSDEGVGEDLTNLRTFHQSERSDNITHLTSLNVTNVTFHHLSVNQSYAHYYTLLDVLNSYFSNEGDNNGKLIVCAYLDLNKQTSKKLRFTAF